MKKKILMFIVICGLAASFSFAGIEWTATQTTTGTGKGQNNEVTAQGFAQGGNVKLVFENAKGFKKDDLMYGQNMYWLFKADDSNIYIVNDAKKTYTVFPLDSLLQLAGAMGQLVKMKISDPSAKVESLPGETLLGYPCNHQKIVTDYGMEMKVLFIKSSAIIHQEREVWSTTKINGFKELHNAFVQKNFKTGFSEMDEMIAKEMKMQGEQGFPLKMVMHQTSETKKGKAGDESTTTMVVTRVETKNIPAGIFEIPASYTKQELFPEEGSGKKKFGIF